MMIDCFWDAIHPQINPPRLDEKIPTHQGRLPRFICLLTIAPKEPASMIPRIDLAKNIVAIYGAPRWIRTTDLSLRRRMLYPAELLVHDFFVPKAGIEPARLTSLDFKSSVFTYFTTWALVPEISASPAGLWVHFTVLPRPRS